MRRLTTDEFIVKAKLVHGLKYDYSITEYTNRRNYIEYICPNHGKVAQLANNHLNGFGCDQCSGTFNLTRESFILSAIEVHGHHFCYDKVHAFSSNKEKVIIVCPSHGEFEQTPHKHLLGQYCPRCKRESSHERRIASILDSIRIGYEREFSMQGMKFKRRLRLDFFIPSMRCAIEVHGRQHFMVVGASYFGGESKLVERQKRDQIKRDYCKKKGIPLLEVRYDDPDPESTVIEFLNKHSDRQFVNPQLKLF